MRVDIEPQDDTRKWRVDVSATGDDNEIVTTWRDGELADLDEPEWLEEAITRVQQVAQSLGRLVSGDSVTRGHDGRVRAWS